MVTDAAAVRRCFYTTAGDARVQGRENKSPELAAWRTYRYLLSSAVH